ncbi:MAG TPA: hypothetical protein VIT42_16705 [Microlunatus sp.]
MRRVGTHADKLRGSSMLLLVEERSPALKVPDNLAVAGVVPCGTTLTQQQVPALLAVVGTTAPSPSRPTLLAEPRPSGRGSCLPPGA